MGVTKPIRIVSGGQTGADRAALDFALAHGLPHGGWCPKGRRAEDGVIPPRYRLIETPVSEYLQRTEWNARDSDGTVIFTLGLLEESPGSAATAKFAVQYGKPWLHLHAASPRVAVAAFVEEFGIRTLNVAGSRSDGSGEIEHLVSVHLQEAFVPPQA